MRLDHENQLYYLLRHIVTQQTKDIVTQLSQERRQAVSVDPRIWSQYPGGYTQLLSQSGMDFHETGNCSTFKYVDASSTFITFGDVRLRYGHLIESIYNATLRTHWCSNFGAELCYHSCSNLGAQLKFNYWFS